MVYNVTHGITDASDKVSKVIPYAPWENYFTHWKPKSGIYVLFKTRYEDDCQVVKEINEFSQKWDTKYPVPWTALTYDSY